MFGKPPPLLWHLPGSAFGWLLRNRCCCLWVKPLMVSPLKQTLWLLLLCANAVPIDSIMANTTAPSSTEIRLSVIVLAIHNSSLSLPWQPRVGRPYHHHIHVRYFGGVQGFGSDFREDQQNQTKR